MFDGEDREEPEAAIVTDTELEEDSPAGSDDDAGEDLPVRARMSMGSVFSQPAECAAPGYPLGRDGNGLPGLQNDDLPFHPDVQQLRRNEVFLRHEDRPAMVSDFFRKTLRKFSIGTRTELTRPS